MAGFLRRYTNVMSMIDLLTKREITLLPTTAWVDRNDRRAIEIFKKKMGFTSVVGLCLTESGETFHHWQIFAGGDSGVAIDFDKDAFIDLFRGKPDFRCGAMRYMKLNDLRTDTALKAADIPFLKRHGFAAEKEFRVIGTAMAETATLAVPFDLSIVRGVTFSPFVNDTLAKSVKEVLRGDPAYAGFRWTHSRLIENESWLTAMEKMAG